MSEREGYMEWMDREYQEELAERRQCFFPNDLAIYCEPVETPAQREKEPDKLT